MQPLRGFAVVTAKGVWSDHLRCGNCKTCKAWVLSDNDKDFFRDDRVFCAWLHGNVCLYLSAIANCSLKDTNFFLWTEALPGLSNMSHLEMRWNHLWASQLFTFILAIGNCKTCKAWVLSDNDKEFLVTIDNCFFCMVAWYVICYVTFVCIYQQLPIVLWKTPISSCEQKPCLACPTCHIWKWGETVKPSLDFAVGTAPFSGTITVRQWDRSI